MSRQWIALFIFLQPFITQTQDLHNNNIDANIQMHSLSEQELQTIYNALYAQNEQIEHLKKENAKLKLNNKTLFFLLGPCIPAAAAAGTLVPHKITCILQDIQNSDHPLHTKLIPDITKHILEMHAINKTLLAGECSTLKFSIKVDHIASSLYQSLAHIVLKKENDKQLLKIVGAHLLTTLCTRAVVQVTQDNTLKGPNDVIILHKSQLLQAACQTCNKELKKYIKDNKNPTITDFAQTFICNLSTEIGYNALVQSIHAIAKQYHYEHPALDLLFPQDCKPKDNLPATYTKMLISYLLPIAAQYASDCYAQQSKS